MTVSEPIGISSLPNQRYKIVSKQGGHFTLMVAGESGVGKTTFINTLFQTLLKQPVDNKNRHKKALNKTTEIDIVRAELEEKNFKLRVNLIDTPGFGDNINNRATWQPIVDFIDDQHESFMRQEQQPNRDSKHDLRVHACLYFIRPTGHSLKPLDIETMKKLGTRVNLIPIIAKADTLSPSELSGFKNRIRSVIEAQEIRIYTPPIELDDQAAADHSKALIESMPFAIICSEYEYDNGNGELIRARKYPWGLAEVENEQYSDFRKLRSLLLRTNLLDLIQSTETLHYEAFRTLKMSSSESSSGNDSIGYRKYQNPKFKEEENALKKFFTDQVKAEEQRFRQWEQNIVNERNRLNEDLDEIQQKVKQLDEEVRQLQLRKK
ncbi:Septin homolog spn4 [Cyberlindnera jadinii]|uniref:Septin n=1 Tax=Cyberlindnera jadinii (strain ATCC 18201 / CBS 1600 / BCRC 20928 / JCM 3617 / NBRC 0987 / NRRL Y-1542) TaxID=983966 RepID=A0A0H5CI86_CYBJN|nr:Septin [Cyberlindnera jadinii NRRL Y-1542]ODV70749.1 Septin [Cyberlindnera jadinii NRRL Y-1542]CEP24269.1 Septin homolog spn4 [Cyberlindnera jadinii]